MKLLIPVAESLHPSDAQLIQLAEFLGIECKQVSIVKLMNSSPAGEREEGDHEACLVINPDVLRVCCASAAPEHEPLLSASARFAFTLVHAIRHDPFHSELICKLSGGRISAVRVAPQGEFQITSGAKDICLSFSGLSIGNARSDNDSVFDTENDGALTNLVTVDDAAFMSMLQTDSSTAFFIGSRSVADLNAEAEQGFLTEKFSCFLPHAMALRHIFGSQCWRPVRATASVIVDDPLLRKNYGFLNFDKLLELCQSHKFHTTLAFIPHNHRRSSSEVVRQFRAHRDHLSLCFHGNDHTKAEFASSDRSLLNALLLQAARRMRNHSQRTGLDCSPVMVFPQGQFSEEAMATLGERGFDAAINTVRHPRHHPTKLTLREMSQPAVQRYAGFPLFLRTPSQQMQEPEIAFRLFFGIPILIVEHHDIFADPRALIEAVTRINRMAPEICWVNAGAAANSAVLQRQRADSTVEIRAYARSIQLENTAASRRRFSIEWNRLGSHFKLHQVDWDGAFCEPLSSETESTRVSVVLDAGSTATFTVRARALPIAANRIPLMSVLRAFARRRLSEFRDQHLCKRPRVLTLAKGLQRRFQQAQSI